MFAVVGQEPVAVLAKPRASPPNGFLAGIFRERTGSYPNVVAGAELRDSDFLDRSAMQPARKSGVMHYLSVTDVNAMVLVATALCHEMSTHRRFNAHRDIRRPRSAGRAQVLSPRTPMLLFVCHGSLFFALVLEVSLA
jgi:hypothetical protein